MQERFEVSSGHDALVRLRRVVADGGKGLPVYSKAGQLLGQVAFVEHDDGEERADAEARLATLKGKLADLPEDITAKAKAALEKAVACLEHALEAVEGDIEEAVRLILDA